MVNDAVNLLQACIVATSMLLLPSFKYNDQNIAIANAAAVLWNVDYGTNGDRITITEGDDVLKIVKGIFSLGRCNIIARWLIEYRLLQNRINCTQA